MRKLLAALCLTILAPVSAFAWGAVVMSGHGEYFNSTSNRGSADEAAAAAMRLCLERMTCRIVGKPQIGKYVAVFVGDASIGEGVDENPESAVIKARKDCERVSRSCKAKHLAWFGKLLYAGIASGVNNQYASLNQPTAEAAGKIALSHCKASQDENCKLVNLRWPYANVYYVQANTGVPLEHYLDWDASDSMAQKKALNGCEALYKKPCIVSGIKVNDGSSSQTDANLAFFRQFWTAVHAKND